MKLVLIDYSNIGHMAWAVNWKSPDPSATSTAIVAKVRELASGQPHCALCIDTGKSFRHDISADYKAHREARPQALYYNMDAALDVLRGDGFPVWGAAGYEADDVVATATIRALSHAEFGDGGLDLSTVLIVSADKDLAQLIGERVTVFSPMTGKTRGLAEMHADFGIQPHQVVDFLSLVGDASDNIKGAEGIGPKKAARFLEMYGNLDDLFRDIDTELGRQNFGDAEYRSLKSFEPRLAEVRSLLTLKTDAPIPFEQIFAERRPLDVATFGDDIDFAMQPLETKQMGELDYAQEQPGFPQEITDVKPRYTPPRNVDEETMRRAIEGAPPPEVAAAEVAARRQQAMAVREPDVQPANVEWEKQLEPRTINEAKQLSDWIFASRLFSAYGHPAGVLTTVLAGRELGLQAISSLRAMHIVDGKPTMAADFIRSLVLRSGLVDYFRCTERTPERATFVIKRKNEPEMSLTYTIEEAQIAGLVKPKSGWERNAADMLVARASSKLARLVCPEITFCMYAREEMEQS